MKERGRTRKKGIAAFKRVATTSRVHRIIPQTGERKKCSREIYVPSTYKCREDFLRHSTPNFRRYFPFLVIILETRLLYSGLAYTQHGRLEGAVFRASKQSLYIQRLLCPLLVLLRGWSSTIGDAKDAGTSVMRLIL